MKKLEQIRSEGRQWVRSYYGDIRTALDTHLQEVLSEADEMPYINPDIYSNALCGCVYRIPRKIREGLTIVQGYFYEKNGGGDPYLDTHTWLTLESLIICPTFGQRRDLDSSIKNAPQLFVGRVLVAYEQEIYNNFDLEYRPQFCLK